MFCHDLTSDLGCGSQSRSNSVAAILDNKHFSYDYLYRHVQNIYPNICFGPDSIRKQPMSVIS